MQRTVLIFALMAAMTTGCRNDGETQPPWTRAIGEPVGAPGEPEGPEHERAGVPVAEAPADGREAIEIDSRWVEVDHAIVAICPAVELRASAVVDPTPAEDAPLEFGEVEQEIEQVQQEAEQARTERDERWRSLARCMNEGPLQNATLAIVEYGPGASSTPEMARALARELEAAGIDPRQLEVERLVEGLAAEDPDPRLVIRIAERDA